MNDPITTNRPQRLLVVLPAKDRWDLFALSLSITSIDGIELRCLELLRRKQNKITPVVFQKIAFKRLCSAVCCIHSADLSALILF